MSAQTHWPNQAADRPPVRAQPSPSETGERHLSDTKQLRYLSDNRP